MRDPLNYVLAFLCFAIFCCVVLIIATVFQFNESERWLQTTPVTEGTTVTIVQQDGSSVFFTNARAILIDGKE